MADVLLGRHGRSLQSAVYWSTPPLNGQAGMESWSGQKGRELTLFPIFLGISFLDFTHDRLIFWLSRFISGSWCYPDFLYSNWDPGRAPI